MGGDEGGAKGEQGAREAREHDAEAGGGERRVRGPSRAGVAKQCGAGEGVEGWGEGNQASQASEAGPADTGAPRAGGSEICVRMVATGEGTSRGVRGEGGGERWAGRGQEASPTEPAVHAPDGTQPRETIRGEGAGVDEEASARGGAGAAKGAGGMDLGTGMEGAEGEAV